MRQGTALVGQDQAGPVQRIAAEHAAHGVRDQFRGGVAAQARLAAGLAVRRGVAVVGVAGQCDLAEGHVGRELLLQAIGLDKEPVVLHLQAAHLVGVGLPLGA